MMEKIIEVQSDDPEKKQFNLVLKGMVESIVTVLPQTVHMQGKPGDMLETKISIKPSGQYPFSVIEVATRNQTPIQTTLIRPDSKDKPWLVSVRITSDKVQSFYDVLDIKTDSQLKPGISVRVFASFVVSERPLKDN